MGRPAGLLALFLSREAWSNLFTKKEETVNGEMVMDCTTMFLL